MFFKNLVGRLARKFSRKPEEESIGDGIMMAPYALSGLRRYTFQLVFEEAGEIGKWQMLAKEYLERLGFSVEKGKQENEVLVKSCEFCSLYPMRIETTHRGTVPVGPVIGNRRLAGKWLSGIDDPDIRVYDVVIDIPKSASYPERDWAAVVRDLKNLSMLLSPS